MDELTLYDLAEKYADSFIDSADYKRFLVLGEEIKQVLSKQIINFKNAEANYLEAKRYENYHPDLTKYQQLFVDAKAELYSHPLVKEYKLLEQKLQMRLDSDLNLLKQSISNKLPIKKINNL